MIDYKNLRNSELIAKYNKSQTRGMIASEMARRAGTLMALFTEKGMYDDKFFCSVMRDTIEVLNTRPDVRY